MAPQWPPIFIVGAPRSGTTLLYQLLTYRLSLSYFLHLAARFPESPAVVTRIITAFRTVSPPPVFTSKFGKTEGWKAPDQGRGIWARWFPADQGQVAASRLPPNQTAALRATIAIIERAFGMPFLNKAQGHCVCMPQLVDAFPQALFVRVHRDHFLTAQSILRGRETYFGDRTHWFSVRPREYDLIKSHEPVRQICEQLYYLSEEMDRATQKIGGERVLNLSYENYCLAPEESVETVREFYRANTGIELAKRGGSLGPFQVSAGVRVSEADSQAIRRHLSELFGSGVAESIQREGARCCGHGNAGSE